MDYKHILLQIRYIIQRYILTPIIPSSQEITETAQSVNELLAGTVFLHCGNITF